MAAAGVLTISAGGTVESAGGAIGSSSDSTSEVTVTGAGSTWTISNTIDIGDDGSGTLTISDGGQVEGTYAFIGFGSGSTGVVTVTGSETTWNNTQNVAVGASGSGTLSIAAGADVYSTSGLIGYTSEGSGEVTVTGSDSTWTNSKYVIVGYSGSGTLTIADGATVSNTTGRIGNSDGSTGEVTVTGSGSTWTNEKLLTVGVYGTGKLSISDNGQVVVKQGASINASSTVNLGLSSANSTLIAIGDEDNTTATLTNEGTVNVFAIGTLASGSYTPISIGDEAEFAGSGVYKVFGGDYTLTTTSFSVQINALTAGTLGVDYGSTLAGVRINFDSGGLVVAFSSDAEGSSFIASELSDTGLESVVAAYEISSSASGDDILLCFGVSDYTDLILYYRADGEGGWSEYDYNELSSYYSLDDEYLSLILDAGDGQYALAGTAVPEPAHFTALGGLLALLLILHRRRVRT